MDFKNVIIMSDLDGTLLDDKKEISPRDMESINEFCDKGGMFTIATGRGCGKAEAEDTCGHLQRVGGV